MSGPRAESSGRSGAASSSTPLRRSPTATDSRRPGRVELRLKDAGSLFDDSAPPKYPYVGPVLQPSVAAFLLQSTRAQRSAPSAEIVVCLTSPPMAPAEESGVRDRISRFFATERELAELDRRVNRVEGLASLRYALPVVLLAVLVIGIFYAQLGTTNAEGYLVALVYVFFVVVVWVMLWDPIEVLLFNSFILRLKIRALRKLAEAKVLFVYSPSEGTPHASQILSADSIRLP